MKKSINMTYHFFTLIELLIVVSILMVLLSILLPALKKSKQAANRIVCMNNLRQQGIALGNYIDNHLHVPPFLSSDIGLKPGYPYDTYYHFSNFGVKGPYGPAYLFKLKYITNPEVFYCPSQPFEFFAWPHYAPFWRTGTTPISDCFVRTSYNYNPHNNASNKFTYSHINKYPLKHAVIFDLIHREGVVSHKTSGVFSWNYLYLDGHVNHIRSEASTNLIVTGTPGLDWNLFRSIRETLENE